MKKGRAFPQVDVDTLEYLPIPRIPLKRARKDENEFNAEIRSSYLSYISNGDSSAMMRIVSDNLDSNPTGFNVVQDILVYLGEQMSLMNQLRKNAINHFRVDLTGILGEKVHQIERLYTPPNKPKSYRMKDIAKQNKKILKYESDITAARDSLGKLLYSRKLKIEDFTLLNNDQLIWLLGARMGKVKDLSQVLSIFQKYRDELQFTDARLPDGMITGMKSLNQRINSPYKGSTDWLIDRIVYALYNSLLRTCSI
jgi:hypothetical protein